MITVSKQELSVTVTLTNIVVDMRVLKQGKIIKSRGKL